MRIRTFLRPFPCTERGLQRNSTNAGFVSEHLDRLLLVLVAEPSRRRTPCCRSAHSAVVKRVDGRTTKAPDTARSPASSECRLQVDDTVDLTGEHEEQAVHASYGGDAIGVSSNVAGPPLFCYVATRSR